jgi:hypothetical protein
MPRKHWSDSLNWEIAKIIDHIIMESRKVVV